MSGLDPRQLRDLIVRPALQALALPGDERIEKLVMGTAAHESEGFRLIKQVGGGPALSPWQIEPGTLRYTIATASEALRMKLLAFTAVTPWSSPGSPLAEQILDQLPGNLYLGAACCRAIYYYKPFKLEELGAGEPEKAAKVWKRVWNSPAGKGTEGAFLANWRRYLSDLYPPSSGSA